MVIQIGCLVEKYSLLTSNCFGGLKKISTIDALVTLQERIYQAWRDEKILSLVTFDVKRDFNRVAPEVLALHFHLNRVSDQFVCSIKQLICNRKASVVVNGITKEVKIIIDESLPQGSKLSAILYLFLLPILFK